MSIQISSITSKQVEIVLTQSEGHFLDFKSVDISPAKLTRTISAFANSSGGEFYVGISELEIDGKKTYKWAGFENQEAANSHLQVFEQLFPLGQYYSHTFLSSADEPGLVLQVNVNKTREITKSSDGTVYIRRGAQNLPIRTDEELKRLEFDKGIQSFETSTVDTNISTITNSTPVIEFLINVVPTAEPEPWLTKQLLIFSGKPTVAGVLLFADEPQAALPKRCGVKIYRYRTSNDEGTRETLAFDPITIEGCLYNQIHDTVTRTVELIEGVQKLGPKGLEPVTYPHETLHEILTNAMLHRDYSIASDVHVRIFDNRIEVESPGRLPGHITPKNILKEQFARNGSIVRIINKFPDPPNKDVGEGLNTAFRAMSQLRLKPPIIEELENSVIVHIRHESLASPEESIMEYLETHDEIVNRIGRQITGINSENSMKNIFYKMRKRELIEPVPGKSGFASAWRKKQQ